MAERYTFFLFIRQLPEIKAAVSKISATYRRNGNGAAADIVDAAYDKHVKALFNLAFDTSVAGTDILRERERETRVRPDSLGRGGPRLGDSLFADPLSAEGLPGSVGVANQDILDRNVPWWPTNEVGSHARVGGSVTGLFEPGGAVPTPTQDREHPVFTAGKGGRMRIGQPIPARYFVRDSVALVGDPWYGTFKALEAELVADVAAAELT